MLCILLIAGSPSYILGHTRKRRLRSLLVLQRMLQKLELQVASFSSSKSMFCVTQHKQQTSAHEENRKKCSDMVSRCFQMFPSSPSSGALGDGTSHRHSMGALVLKRIALYSYSYLLLFFNIRLRIAANLS